MEDVQKRLKKIQDQLEDAIRRLNIEADEEELKQLDGQMQSADFWSDSLAAGEVSRKAADLRRHILTWRNLQKDLRDALELAELYKGGSENLPELEAMTVSIEKQYSEREFELKMSGPYDRNGAILSIYAGTGGTDAQDWADMLFRMYLRYSERNGFQAAVLDQSMGEEAGIKSVTIEINGQYAYGKLRSEKGVHRLVRLSPFNSDNLRQTSFALVDVMPQIDQADEVEIDPKDLRIDVYRAGGHGGQSVNTTDSAVRITHIPTGTVVAIQNERSQLQNKEKAMAILKSRLTALMIEQQKEEISDIRGETQSAAWGNQIRSYVLHPYTKVKDHRTGEETSDTGKVLDGDLEAFIQAFLKGQIGGAEV